MVRGDDRYSTFDALTGQDHTGLSPVYWTAGFTMGLQKRYIGEKETRLLKEQVLSDELGEAIAAILCLIGNHMDDRVTPLPVTETVHRSLFRGVFPSSGFLPIGNLSNGLFLSTIHPTIAPFSHQFHDSRNWRLYKSLRNPQKRPAKLYERAHALEYCGRG